MGDPPAAKQAASHHAASEQAAPHQSAPHGAGHGRRTAYVDDRPMWQRTVGVVGELLVTVGILLAGFVYYQVAWTNHAAAQAQSRADGALDEAWRAGQYTNPRQGARGDGAAVPFARLWIPEFGSDFRYAVVEGVGDAELETGPGHYPFTQGPGEPGNFALAGHRVGRGSPFNDLDRLRTCSPLVVETADRWLVYRVLPLESDEPDASRHATECLPHDVVERLRTDYAGVPGRSIVVPSSTDVLNPIPGSPAPPDPKQLPLLTLTTCHPQFSAAERMIVHAVLAETTPKHGTELPDVLRGG